MADDENGDRNGASILLPLYGPLGTRSIYYRGRSVELLCIRYTDVSM